MDNKIFAKGINFKRNENAPEFVVGKLSIKTEEAISFLNENSKSGWVNLDIKKAKSGKYYIELDNFEYTNKVDVSLISKSKKIDNEDLPF